MSDDVSRRRTCGRQDPDARDDHHDSCDVASTPLDLSQQTPSIRWNVLPFAVTLAVCAVGLILGITDQPRRASVSPAAHAGDGAPTEDSFTDDLQRRTGVLAPVAIALSAGGILCVLMLAWRRYRAWLLPPPFGAPRVPWGRMALAQAGVLAVALSVVQAQIAGRIGDGSPLRVVGYVLPQLALLAALAVTVVAGRAAASGESVGALRLLGLVAPPTRQAIARGVVGYLALYPCVVAAAGAGEFVNGLLGLEVPAHPMIREVALSTGTDTVALVVAAVVAAPLVEELVFRGFLYATLRERWGVVPGVIASSLLFALVHRGLPNQAVTFVMGALLCVYYERSRSVYVPILVHALFNGTQIAMVLLAWHTA